MYSFHRWFLNTLPCASCTGYNTEACRSGLSSHELAAFGDTYLHVLPKNSLATRHFILVPQFLLTEEGHFYTFMYIYLSEQYPNVGR